VLQRSRLVALAVVICVGLIAIGAYSALRPRTPCVTDGNALKGEVKRGPDGKSLYFDGKCWTPKPMPPRDMPF
jgi:hypothetical protein